MSEDKQMNTLEKLQHLIATCCQVIVTSNDHRVAYQTVAQWFDEHKDWSSKSREACIAHDSIVEVQVYPSTPIGFNVYVSHDLVGAIDAAYEDMKVRGGK